MAKVLTVFFNSFDITAKNLFWTVFVGGLVSLFVCWIFDMLKTNKPRGTKYLIITTTVILSFILALAVNPTVSTDSKASSTIIFTNTPDNMSVSQSSTQYPQSRQQNLPPVNGQNYTNQQNYNSTVDTQSDSQSYTNEQNYNNTVHNQPDIAFQNNQYSKNEIQQNEQKNKNDILSNNAISQEVRICYSLGLFDNDKLDSESDPFSYLNKCPTRLEMSIIYLKLLGLYETAIRYNSEDNFEDAKSLTSANDRAALAFLKACPELHQQGDGVNYFPEKEVEPADCDLFLLEALRYQMTTCDINGDFTWGNVLEFSKSQGLYQAANCTSMNFNNLAVAIVECLNAKLNSSDVTEIQFLVNAGVVDKQKALNLGFSVN